MDTPTERLFTNRDVIYKVIIIEGIECALLEAFASGKVAVKGVFFRTGRSCGPFLEAFLQDVARI